MTECDDVKAIVQKVISLNDMGPPLSRVLLGTGSVNSSSSRGGGIPSDLEGHVDTDDAGSIAACEIDEVQSVHSNFSRDDNNSNNDSRRGNETLPNGSIASITGGNEGIDVGPKSLKDITASPIHNPLRNAPDAGCSGRTSPGGTLYKGRGVRKYQGRYMNLTLQRFQHNCDGAGDIIDENVIEHHESNNNSPLNRRRSWSRSRSRSRSCCSGRSRSRSLNDNIPSTTRGGNSRHDFWSRKDNYKSSSPGCRSRGENPMRDCRRRWNTKHFSSRSRTPPPPKHSPFGGCYDHPQQQEQITTREERIRQGSKSESPPYFRCKETSPRRREQRRSNIGNSKGYASHVDNSASDACCADASPGTANGHAAAHGSGELSSHFGIMRDKNNIKETTTTTVSSSMNNSICSLHSNFISNQGSNNNSSYISAHNDNNKNHSRERQNHHHYHHSRDGGYSFVHKRPN